jgi:hypothetical protein
MGGARHLLQDIRNIDPTVTFAPSEDEALANAAKADVIVVVVGELAYAEGVGDNPAPALPLTQIEIPWRLQKSNGACTPWMCPPVPNQINCSRSPVEELSVTP